MNNMESLCRDMLDIGLDSAIKGVVLLMAAWGLSRMLKSRAASVRHLVWLAAMMGLVLLPIFSAGLPAWRLAVLPQSQKQVAASPVYVSSTALSASQHRWVPVFEPYLARPEPPQATKTQEVIPVVATETPAPSLASRVYAACKSLSWCAWVLLAWAVGFVLAMTPWLRGMWAMRRLARRCRRIKDGEGPWRVQVNGLCRQLRIRQRVRILLSEDRAMMPLAFGILRPTLVLPADCEGWDASRREIVAMHELAHVKRRDSLTLAVGQVARALHWFDPLAWHALRELRLTCEQAADDVALIGGARSTDYAAELLAIARDFAVLPDHAGAGLAMARPSSLESRLRQILAEGLNRSAATRRAAVMALVCIVSVLAPLASLQLTTRQARAQQVAAVTPATQPERLEALKPLDPKQGVELEICRKWRAAGWTDADMLATGYSHSYASGHPIFRVTSPGKMQTWIYYLDQPIDLKAYPIFKMRYRAQHITHRNLRYTLWIDDGGGPNGGGMHLLRPREVIDDSQDHEVRHDMRQLKAGPQFKGMALCVYGDETGLGQIELLDMRFEAAADSEPRALPAEDGVLAVKVLDDKGQPVADAVVIADAERRNFARQARSGADGVAAVKPLATSDGKHKLRIERQGFAPMELVQGVGAADGASPIQATLFRTGRFSGQVVDPEGKPVAGATVEAWMDGEGYDRNRVRLDAEAATVTDAQGQWALTLVDSPKCTFRLRFAHGDYISDRWGGQNYKVSMDEIRSGKSIVRMQRGIQLAGTVRDASGNPVAGASVAQGDDRFPSNSPPATVTDKDGRYKFAGVDPGKLVLTVTAKGCAPELTSTQAQGGMKDIDFVLKPGKTIRFRVVDKDGKPIAKARVCADTWRGYRTIPTDLETNADGQVTWDGAPEDTVQYDIYAKDYMSARRKALVAGDSENVITLPPLLKVSGAVTDAQTGQAIPAFTVVEGIQWEGRSEVSWQRRDGGGRPGVAGNGRYERTFDYPYPGQLVRIEADGYQPAVSRAFKSDEGTQTFDFKLTKAKEVKIQVLTPDGKPAGGAMAAVATASEQLSLRNGSIERNQTTAAIREIDASGQYTLPPSAEAKGALVITHESGYVQMPYEQAAQKTELRLTPWGKVEAILKVGSNVANQKISIWQNDYTGEPGQPRIFEQMEGQTDANGRCVFDRVRAGKLSVGNYFEIYQNAWTSSHSKQVTLEAGQSVSVVIGGEGRPVVGRLEMPADFPSARRFEGIRISTKPAVLAKPPYPDGFMGWPVEKRREWFEQWKQTDEGKAYVKTAEEENAKRRSFSGRVNDDGTFRVEDIPAGTYTMNVGINEPPVGASCGITEQLGYASGEFTMPEVPGGKSSEVLDVGALKVVRKVTLKAGDVAPDLTVKTLDGKELKLSDQRGKFVLLDFWAVWCGPCVAETPHLKKVYEQCGQDPRFVMIGLSLDPEVKTPTDYVKSNGISWLQGFLGEWSAAEKWTSPYGVQGIPSIFLIGPDGKIVARNLRGEQILSTVQSELAKAAKAP